MREVRSAENHVVVEYVALDVVNAQDLVPSGRQEARDHVLGQHGLIQEDAVTRSEREHAISTAVDVPE